MSAQLLTDHAQHLLLEVCGAEHIYVYNGKTIGFLPENADSLLLDLRDGAALDEKLMQSAKEKGLPVAVICGNALEGALAFSRVLEGDATLPSSSVSGYTTEGLDRQMLTWGYVLEHADVSVPVWEHEKPVIHNMHARDMDRIEDMDLLDQMSVYDEDRPNRVSLLMQDMMMQGPYRGLPHLVRLYMPCNDMASRPFLSVIIRTMGTRMDPLRDALLCLAAQNDQDFEVLLMGHKVGEAEDALIKDMIDAQIPELQKKIRYYRVPDGGRAHPINEGIDHARGRYFSVFDDDDFLFDTWVEHFREAAAISPGRVLHQYAVGQSWSTYERDGKTYPISMSAYNNLFCANFDMLSEASYNRCPLMSLAFPTMYYQQLGQRFDETLDVCEDWEYLMRLSNLFGVRDVPKVGAIYRIWESQDNSHAVNSEEKWRETEKRIMKSLASRPVLMPTEWLEGYVDMDRVYKRMVKKDVYLLDTVLYSDYGAGFEEMKAEHYKENIFLEELNLTFTLQGDGLRAIRWDPVVKGSILLDGLKIEVKDANDQPVSIRQVYTNGREVVIPKKHSLDHDRDGIFFDVEDPQMVYAIDPVVGEVTVHITGRMQERFTSEEMALYRKTGVAGSVQKLSDRTQETLYRLKRKAHKVY